MNGGGQEAEPLSWSRPVRPKGGKGFLLGVLVTNFLLVAVVLSLLHRNNLDAEETARGAAENLSHLLEQYLSSAIHEIDLTLLSVSDEAERQLREGGIDERAFNVFLERQQARLADIISLRATDAEGNVRFGAGVDPGAKVNLSDRDFVIEPRDHPQHGLSISKPILARITKQWVIAFGRRYSRPDGSFGGVAYINVALGRLNEIFARVDIGEHGVINLFYGDRSILARRPDLTDIGVAVGTRFPSPRVEALIAGKSGTAFFKSVSPVDGVARSNAFRQITGRPLYLILGLAEQDYLADWRWEAAIALAFVGVFTASTLAFSMLLWRSWRRQDDALRNLGEAQTELRSEVAVRRQAETTLRLANDELRQFVNVVSHDLRAPLTTIRGFLTILEDACGRVRESTLPPVPPPGEGDDGAVLRDLRETIPEAIRFIGAAALTMGRLIEAVLGLSRAGRREFHPETVNVAEVVGEILEALAFQIEEKKVQVTVESLPAVTTDRLALQQVFGNLMGNAVKCLDRARPGRITVSAEAAPGRVTFRVADNGRGIAGNDIPRAFEVFRRVGVQDTEGEGMGLAYVQILVRRMGGEVGCESEPGKGSTFFFTLPA